MTSSFCMALLQGATAQANRPGQSSSWRLVSVVKELRGKGLRGVSGTEDLCGYWNSFSIVILEMRANIFQAACSDGRKT